jgi:hypothetical protein
MTPTMIMLVTLVVIFLFQGIKTLGDQEIITKYNLRQISNNDKNVSKEVEVNVKVNATINSLSNTNLNISITDTFKTIYFSVIERENNKHDDFYFTIMCTEIPNETETNYLRKHPEDCMTEDIENKDQLGHQLWKKNNPINALTIYNISLELYAQEVINKLYDTIPDITIIKINKNCCDHYVLSL